MMSKLLRNSSFAAVLVTSACADDDPFAGPLQFSPPVATRSHVTFVDQVRADVVFVSPGATSLDVKRVPLHDTRAVGLWCAGTLDQRELLVLSAPRSAKDEDVGSRLLRFSGDGGLVGEYDLEAPFTSIALSPDLRRAILYFGSQSQLEHLQNSNQAAVVDFTTDEVRPLTLDGFGGGLRGVDFPAQSGLGEPSFVDVDGVLRDLAVFLVEGEVILIDLADPTASQVAVSFEGLPFVPTDTLLRPADALFPRPTLFVRALEGTDVAMLTLVGKEDGGFTVQVSLVPVGGTATDLATFAGAEVPYLLSAVGHGLVFTDIRTHQSFDISMGATERVFLRSAPGEFGPVTQAVTWAAGGSQIMTLELDAIEDTLSRRPSELKVEQGIGDLVQLDDDRVLVGSGQTLYVVDLGAEQVTPLTSGSSFNPRSSAFDGDRLILGTEGQEWLSSVDLVTLNPESMLLDYAIDSFHNLPDTGRVLLMHNDPLGLATVVDAADPSRATSYTAWGFLVEGAMERGK